MMSEHVIEIDFLKYKSLFDHCASSCGLDRTIDTPDGRVSIYTALSGDELTAAEAEPISIHDKKQFIDMNGTSCDCILDMIREAIDKGHKFSDIAIDVRLTKDIKERLFTKGLAIIFDRENAILPHADSMAAMPSDPTTLTDQSSSSAD